MYTSFLKTPIGILTIKADESVVYSISCNTPKEEELEAERKSPLTELVAGQLTEYFEGRRWTFDFKTKQQGSDFQQAVWDELLHIRPGYPISYAALSRRLGNPLAIRAIASANGKNNLMIVVPCHRVIGSSGKLVGYAGGLWRKQWLLEHEARMMKTGQTTLL